jgi:hypothetical protein
MWNIILSESLKDSSNLNIQLNLDMARLQQRLVDQSTDSAEIPMGAIGMM